MCYMPCLKRSSVDYRGGEVKVGSKGNPQDIWNIYQRGWAGYSCKAFYHQNYQHKQQRDNGARSPNRLKAEENNAPREINRKLRPIQRKLFATAAVFSDKVGGEAHKRIQNRPHNRKQPRGRQQRRLGIDSEKIRKAARKQRGNSADKLR